MKIGLDDFAQKIMFIQLPKVGSVLQQNEYFVTIESMKCVEELNAPVSGSIIGVNNILRSKPGLINADPHGEGWIARVKPIDKLIEELKSLIHGDAVISWLKRENDKISVS